MTTTTHRLICPACGERGDPGDDWRVRFCPSLEEPCDGCAVDEEHLECPECFEQWAVA